MGTNSYVAENVPHGGTVHRVITSDPIRPALSLNLSDGDPNVYVYPASQAENPVGSFANKKHFLEEFCIANVRKIWENDPKRESVLIIAEKEDNMTRNAVDMSSPFAKDVIEPLTRLCEEEERNTPISSEVVSGCQYPSVILIADTGSLVSWMCMVTGMSRATTSLHIIVNIYEGANVDPETRNINNFFRKKAEKSSQRKRKFTETNAKRNAKGK